MCTRSRKIQVELSEVTAYLHHEELLDLLTQEIGGEEIVQSLLAQCDLESSDLIAFLTVEDVEAVVVDADPELALCSASIRR